MHILGYAYKTREEDSKTKREHKIRVSCYASEAELDIIVLLEIFYSKFKQEYH